MPDSQIACHDIVLQAGSKSSVEMPKDHSVFANIKVDHWRVNKRQKVDHLESTSIMLGLRKSSILEDGDARSGRY